ncbi:MAG TPA: phage tail sheath subtilisin-like domain-containing protein [Kofleriaceae bacterium]|nr:phage tail sheath subtilisin-like domain-containing protein [Kofleriaceae bacterium]
MGNELLASKVVIVEEEPRIRAIPALPTAILAAVGITERGPVGQAVLVTSFEEFVDTFGGYTPNSDLALAIDGYFANGGQVAWVVRTVHYTNIVDATTKTAKAASLTLKDRAAAPLSTLRVDAKWDGAYANDIHIVIGAPTSGAPDQINLVVQDSGLIAETFPNLSLNPAAASYVEAVINDIATGSRLISVTDLASATASPANLPALGRFGPLVGGDDGLANLGDPDFVGDAAGKTGLHAFDNVQSITILIVPGRATAAVHNAMLTYCEVVRNKGCFAVLDPPAHQSAIGIIAYAESTAAILGLSELGALYWPRVRVLNPSQTVFGTAASLIVPPSGHIAGVYARLDGARPGGVFVPPAGLQNGVLREVIGFESDEVLDEAKRDLVFPKRINPLTVFPGTPRHIDGARTLKGDGNFPTVAERRGVSFIEQSLKLGLQIEKHQNNTESLRARLTRTVSAFLFTQLKNGAFATTDPKTAYFVDFGEAINPPSVIASGQVVGRIGLATAKPAEFIVLRFSQDTRALDAELAAATGG